MSFAQQSSMVGRAGSFTADRAGSSSMTWQQQQQQHASARVSNVTAGSEVELLPHGGSDGTGPLNSAEGDAEEATGHKR